ncbi:MAG: Ig-like domain-containing protein [Christensenellales bacterium]
MNHYLKNILILMIMILSLAMLMISCDRPEDSSGDGYKLIADADLCPGQRTGLSFYINDEKISPDNLNESYEFAVIEGEEYAQLTDELELIISDDAPDNALIKVKVSKRSEEFIYSFTVTRVEVQSLEISVESEEFRPGSSIKINHTILPDNSIDKDIEYTIIEGGEHITLSDGIIYVNNNAMPGIKVVIKGECGGVESNAIEFTIVKIPVESVTLNTFENITSIAQGDSVGFTATVLPENATYKDVEYKIDSGVSYATISEEGFLSVRDDASVGGIIRIIATADGVDSAVYELIVTELVITGVELSAEKYNVEIGGSTELFAQVLPYSAEGITVAFGITNGASYASIENGTLNILPIAPSGGIVKVIAWAENADGEIENTQSNEIEIFIYKVAVTSVNLFTNDDIENLEPDSVINFEIEVFPHNATDKNAQFIIMSGASYASVNRNSGALTVLKNNEDGEVNLVAIVDGVTSNAVKVNTKKYYHTLTNITWDSFDYAGNAFKGDNYSNYILNIKDMPEDASLTTIVVPYTVRRLVIVGSYSYVAPNKVRNLFFYFNRASEIELTLRDCGIETTLFNRNPIFDFPEGSNARIKVEGNCYIKAGRAINPYDYSVDGVYDELYEKNDYRKNGQDGYNGANGGTGISGDTIEIYGDGSLYISGGDGASGSHGGNGANLPIDAQPNSYSGNGGNGGSGGNGGYAVYANIITINMEQGGVINAFSGNAGRGGRGGNKGQSIPGCKQGDDGLPGINGSIVSAICAYNQFNILSGNIYQTNGILSEHEWFEPPYETLNEVLLRMERSYGLDMHIKSDFIDPYSQYPMTELHDETKIYFIVRIIDNVLSKYPDNIFREMRLISSKQVNIYVVNTIKSGSIAGLAASTNNIWLPYSAASIRNIFYSDVENFAFHELTHLIIYNANSYFSESSMRALNANLPYYSTGTYYSYVYNGDNWDKNNGYFLTTYSRKSYQEDICETLSMISRQGRRWDFLEIGASVRSKMIYIAGAIENGYETASYYETEYWERLIEYT